MDRTANAMLIVSGVAQALGGEVEVADPAKVRADFDAALCAVPSAPSEREALMEALGLRR